MKLKKRMTKTMASTHSILFILLLFLSSTKFISSYELTILHNNDFHSRFAPIDEDGSPCDETKHRCIAGAARTVQKVKDIRREADPNRPVLFLSAGDFFQGSLWYTSFKHEVVSAFVPEMGYDAMSLGNHEFDDGVDGLLPFVKNATNHKPPLPILCSNLNFSAEPRLKDVKPSMTVILNNRRIGIIGYLLPATTYLAEAGPTVFLEDEIVAVKREVQKLKSSGVNIIIGLGHSGYPRDMEIAKAIPDLDIVIGGHTNTFLWNNEDGPPPSKEKPQGSYPTVVDHGDGRRSLVVTAYAFGKYLGRLDVAFDDEGVVKDFAGKPIYMNSTLAQDPKVKEKVAYYQKQVDKLYSDVIGRSAVYLEGLETACRQRECSMGNLASDALVYGFLGKNREHGSWTKYPIAIDVGGDIRASYNASENKGNITLGDVVAVLPFSNSIVAVKAKGKVIWEMFEHSVSQYDWVTGRFLQVSGVQVTYDLSKPVGSRVVNMFVRCGKCDVPKYEPINLEANYNFLTTDYLANGGDDYHMLTTPDVVKESFDEMKLDLVLKYIKSHGVIMTGLEGRIKFETSSSAKIAVSSGTILLSILSLMNINRMP